jgi:SOS response regulatory protein OraA/RecX
VLLEELAAKGVDPEIAAGALEEAGLDESAQATELAWRLLRRYAGKPLDQQAAKVMAALLRKGFSEEASREAVRTVLPPEGWD